MLDRPPAGGSIAAGGGSRAPCGGRSPAVTKEVQETSSNFVQEARYTLKG